MSGRTTDAGGASSDLLPPPPEGAVSENERLQEFGYKQRLDRSIGRIASFAIGFSAISATTAVFSSFGVGYFTAGGPFVWTLLIAVAVFFVWALIAADLAAKFPLAGYAYQWTSRLNGSNLGWFTGFIAIIGWISGLTGVSFVFAGYLGSVFGFTLTLQVQILMTIGSILVAMLITAYGIRLTTLINNIGVAIELVVTVLATIVVAVIAFVIPENHQPVSVLFEGSSSGGSPYIIAWFAAALGPFFGLVGVEASADVAEETKAARHTIPKTMFTALAVSSVIELLMYIVYVLAIRDHDAVVAASSAPIAEIISQQAGPVVSRIVVAFALTNIFACLLANILLASRLMYSLSRDNMLPASRIWRRVAPGHKTPANAAFVIAAVAILLCLSALFNASAFTYFLGIGSLAFFGVYLLQTVGLLIARRKGRIPAPEHGTFDLGRWRLALYVIGFVMFAIIEIALAVLPQFAGNIWVFLGVVAIGAAWWLLAIRPRLRRGDAGPQYASTHPAEFADEHA
jgi:amino acid transporter